MPITDLLTICQCVRLSKKCEYPGPPTLESTEAPDLAGRLRYLEQLLNVSSTSQAIAPQSPGTNLFSSLQGPSRPFPPSFFLDVDFFASIRSNDLAWSQEPSVQQIASSHLGADHITLCEDYFSTTHRWLPMISRKRLMNELHENSEKVDSCQPLLFLCMKLCNATDPEIRPMESPLYTLTRSLFSAAESAGFVSLRLVQSIILLTVYELSHAIYPAAYLTIGRAARLGALMGLYNKNSPQQLFMPADTWTLREEQRRTWWAIFVLDRYCSSMLLEAYADHLARFISIEKSDLPFSAPEPFSDELLPINDEDWDKGKIEPSEPLYTASFSYVDKVGLFARTCQAAHVLGKVIRHKDTRTFAQDVSSRLQEAQNLHRALSALHLSLEEAWPDDGTPYTPDSSRLSALAICISARFLLYNQYGCNEENGITGREHIALETEMQSISLDGIKILASSVVSRIAQAESRCPLVAQCLYHAATECAWFIREDNEPEMREALRHIVQGLGHLGEQCNLGCTYGWSVYS